MRLSPGETFWPTTAVFLPMTPAVGAVMTV